MRDKEHILDRSTLKVGDKVGIKVPTYIGFLYFRYQKMTIRTIARITPSRTKFVMDDGTEWGKHETFYEVTERDRHETHVAQCAEKISKYISHIDDVRRRGELFNQNDEKIIRLCGLLESVVKELS